MSKHLLMMIAALMLLGGPAALAGEPPLLPAKRPGPEEPGSIIKRFVDPLLRPPQDKGRTLFKSDNEHAESLGPLMTAERPVFLHTVRSVKPLPNDRNFILENGRIFLNYEEPQQPDKAPRIGIRSTDGGQRIPFILRMMLLPRALDFEEGVLEVGFSLPAIFQPRLEIESVRLDGRKMNFRVQTGPAMDTFDLVIPLRQEDLEAAAKSRNGPAQMFLGGYIHLSEYKVLDEGDFAPRGRSENQEALRGIAQLIINRDYTSEEEKTRIMEIANGIREKSSTSLEEIRRVNRYVLSKIRYFRNSMKRTSMQVIDEGFGDCDDYTRIMITLLRALGIPCKAAIGNLYDFNHFGAHAWVEAALPLRNGQIHWFICDPTLASAADDKDDFIQFKNRLHIYQIDVRARSLNIPMDEVTDVLFNWQQEDSKEKVSFQIYPTLINSFLTDFTQSIQATLAGLQDANLTFTREFAFMPGSSYILVDHGVPKNLPKVTDIDDPDELYVLDQNKEEIRSRFQVKLDSKENLIFEVGVLDEDDFLESPGQRRQVEWLRFYYKLLCEELFQGAEFRNSVELVFSRDRHSDRLQKVQVRIGRYLVEHQFKAVIEQARKANLLTSKDFSGLEKFHRLGYGKNLYLLLDLGAASRTRVANPLPLAP